MNRQVIHCVDENHWHECRVEDITSTESPSLFRRSPYLSPFDLWYRKRDKVIVEIPDNERMLWGRRLQDAIGTGVAEDLFLDVRRMDEYIRLPDLRIGSSFDFSIEHAHARSPFAKVLHELGPGILEVKNLDYVAFRDNWKIDEDDGERFVEAPAHIEIQLQHQLLTAGRRWGLIVALISGNSYEVLFRRADQASHDAILRACASFWSSIGADEPPVALMPDDADAVIGVYDWSEPGKEFDARNRPDVVEKVRRYYAARQAFKAAEDESKVAKAELLLEVKDADYIVAPGFKSVKLGMVSASEPTTITPDMVGQTYGGRAGHRRITIKPAD